MYRASPLSLWMLLVFAAAVLFPGLAGCQDTNEDPAPRQEQQQGMDEMADEDATALEEDLEQEQRREERSRSARPRRDHHRDERNIPGSTGGLR